MPDAAKVRAILAPDEPDYSRAAELGQEAIPAIRELAHDQDPLLAAKAVYLASLLSHPEAEDVVLEAAESDVQQVRVAAAAAAANLEEPTGTAILTSLMNDPDVGIRKVAVESATRFQAPALTALVEDLTRSDPVAELRQFAASALEEMRSDTDPG